ncbi:MAG: ribosomal protein L7/L12 [Armatimonadetes bacterium]|nr:ribosomal protein L7/L12 [Armatimonadota bacterium]
MTRSRIARAIAILGMVAVFILHVYDVIRLHGAEILLVYSWIFFISYFIANPPRPRTKAPVRTPDPIILTALARSIELRDGVKRRLGRATDAEAGEGKLDIALVAPGQSKIKTIKRLRQLYDIGPVPAKAMVDAAPVVIRAGASRTEADYVAGYLAQAGAKVDVTEAKQ